MSEGFRLAELIQSVRNGSPSARETIILHYYPKVRALVHRRLRKDFRQRNRWMLGAFSTSDIVQEVFIGALSRLEGFEHQGEEALLKYLSTLVHNRIHDMLRFHGADCRDVRRVADLRKEIETDWDPESPDATPCGDAAFAEYIEIYRDVLTSFQEKQRVLLRMRIEDEAPFAECAKRLGYASDDVARKMFTKAYATLLLRLKRRGVSPTVDPGKNPDFDGEDEKFSA